jgi:hypothetical protein
MFPTSRTIALAGAEGSVKDSFQEFAVAKRKMIALKHNTRNVTGPKAD